MKSFAVIVSLLTSLSLPLTAQGAEPAPLANPQVRLTTTLGVIELELDARKAPKTVANFMQYVDQGFYNGTIFHRVIPGFMIQGGGMAAGMKEKAAGTKIQNEADNGLKNFAGTIAMARTSDPHSASAQFFINTVDNSTAEWKKRERKNGRAIPDDATFLDHKEKTPQGWGYAVFGKVTKGMDVVMKIEAVKTGNAGFHQNVPRADVVLVKAERLKPH